MLIIQGPAARPARLLVYANARSRQQYNKLNQPLHTGITFEDHQDAAYASQVLVPSRLAGDCRVGGFGGRTNKGWSPIKNKRSEKTLSAPPGESRREDGDDCAE